MPKQLPGVTLIVLNPGIASCWLMRPGFQIYLQNQENFFSFQIFDAFFVI